MKAVCFSEYDLLKKVILCEPQYMRIKDVINETQKHFENEGIHIKTAMIQHQDFVAALKKLGIEVIILPSFERYPEQVFTRDIGFTLGEQIFVAEMGTDIRTGEEHVLIDWLQKADLPFINLTGDRIEGGDVLIDRTTIYVGISNRTKIESIEKLQKLLPQFEIIGIPFTDTYLHLDCVFNIISPTEALIFPGEINKEELHILASRYDLIEVTEDEQFTLGTNVLSVGHNKIISLPVNIKVNRELRKRGYEVIEVDITEIIKSGGAFRCCTMPIIREKQR
ncbi:N-dimethylarginine dimethylaminohydrolase [Peribacillus deserti]|uniref:N-dimethylarginine dimethylaminohydrolase n=1 Tax=Peribacillus deserti TaxID=673318 RepID=A0ABS2QDL3_9BACI|nr:dimethylarginine dimethylaminohydrolase family protein [Peribacillus deserti]MBM7691228.1 N-dimethylarginine dimethylaminohydrolase [Peribacillus deserti]